jgi:hypothetical protein
MSKVLKFIVNLVVLLSIVVAVALLVPPLLGVDTVINDNSNIETNLPVGAVAYGRQVDTEKLKKKIKFFIWKVLLSMYTKFRIWTQQQVLIK